MRFHEKCWLLKTAGRWPWKSESPKECVTTHPPKQATSPENAPPHSTTSIPLTVPDSREHPASPRPYSIQGHRPVWYTNPPPSTSTCFTKPCSKYWMETLTPTTDVEASIQNGERRYTRTPFQHSNIKQCPSYKRFTPDANGKNQQKQHLLPWLRSCSTLQPLTPQGKSFFPYPHMCTLSSPPEGSGFFIGAPALGDQGSFFPYPHMCARLRPPVGNGFF